MEVTTIPDIRERNDRPKDKQPKHQAASIVQRQMVQKFTKELGDSAKQSDRSDNAERAATEQVETTAREIVHEAVQFPRRVLQRPIRGESVDSPANEQPEQSDQPHHALESPRERTGTQRTRPDATPPQNIPTPAPQEQARRAYVQQTAKTATPAPPITSGQPKVQYPTTVAVGENVPRQRTDDVRTRSEPKQPQSAPAPTPQEQTRRAYVQQTAKEAAPVPTITPEQPRGCHVAPSAPLTENTPRLRTEVVRAPDQSRSNRNRSAYQPPHRRNRPDAPMPSKPQGRLRQHHLRHWKKIHHVSARTIYAPGQKQSTRRAYQRQRRRSKAAAPVSSGQRNPAQKNRLRGITFIRSSLKSGLRTVCRRKELRRFVKSRKHQKSVVRCNPKLYQQKHPLSVMQSSRTHGHHAARRLRPCAARSSLFVSGRRLHRRTIYRPYHRSRPNKSL